MGSIPGQEPEPVAWVNVYGPRKARIFYTSLGYQEDFAKGDFPLLLSNALDWALRSKSDGKRSQSASLR